MTARQSAPTDAALRAVRRGVEPRAAAKKHGIALTTILRAMRRAGMVTRPQGRPPTA